MNYAGIDMLQYRLQNAKDALAAGEPIDASCVEPEIEETETSVRIRQNWSASKSSAAILKQLEELFHNINQLRDVAKHWATQNGQDVGAVDELVKANEDVAICVDVDNGLKHVVLSKPGRTGRKPRIERITRGLRLTVGPTPTPIPGLAARIDERGRPRAACDDAHPEGEIVTQAEIVDSEGNTMGDAREIARRAIEGWEHLLREWDIEPSAES